MTDLLRMPEQNKAMIVGRATRDAELRFTQSNQAVCSFTVAASRYYKDQVTGQWKEIPSFIPVVTWAKLAEQCGERLKKGNAVAVEGRIQSRAYESKTGEKRTLVEVVADRVQFLTRSVEMATSEAAGVEKTTHSVHEPAVNEGDTYAETTPSTTSDEEIPF